MGYWDNQGATPTKVTWSNPQIVPENQRQNGGWYYNPSSGYVERWWSGSGGGGGNNSQQNQAPQPPSAEEIMRRAAEERNRKYQEMSQIWNQFMGSPTFWDAALARQMSEQYLNPYYQSVLEDYVNPLQKRINFSQQDETRLLQELTRQRDVGEAEKKDELMTNIEKAQGGFAGAGIYGGGSARRSLARTKIAGSRDLQDFLEGNAAQQANIAAKGAQERELYQGDIEQKQRDVAHEKQGAIEQDVAEQKTNAYKKRAAEAYNTISSKFGSELASGFAGNIPSWLMDF